MTRRPHAWRAILALAAPVLLAGAHEPPDNARPAMTPPACVAGPDPYQVRLVATAHANGASGIVRLTFAESPYVVTVTSDGHHRYQARITTDGLAGRDGALVVWAATPELDRVRKLGTLAADGTLPAAEITFNKFLVFVTEEDDAGVDRWQGRILLRGISPSGRLHTMAGHGPFQAESCGGVFGPQW